MSDSRSNPDQTPFHQYAGIGSWADAPQYSTPDYDQQHYEQQQQAAPTACAHCQYHSYNTCQEALHAAYYAQTTTAANGVAEQSEHHSNNSATGSYDSNPGESDPSTPTSYGNHSFPHTSTATSHARLPSTQYPSNTSECSDSSSNSSTATYTGRSSTGSTTTAATEYSTTSSLGFGAIEAALPHGDNGGYPGLGGGFANHDQWGVGGFGFPPTGSTS